MLDLVLRGGRVCCCSVAQARDADVGIDAGRIVAIGRVDGAARRTLDVRGLVVAPGFVDVHTHYDAQVTWDRLCTPSCWHGVTSVVIGNCGFALAPCRSSDRERLLRMLEHVEGMPFASSSRRRGRPVAEPSLRWAPAWLGATLVGLAAGAVGPLVSAR